MPLRRLIGLGCALGLASLGLSSPASAAEVWPVPPDATITVDGHGYGHGRGLSQYGAEHAAAARVGYRGILDHYYPGTSRGTAGGSVRVWLSVGDIGNAVVVDASPKLRVQKTGGGTSWLLAKQRKKASRWRIVPQGDRSSRVQYRTRGWHTLRTVRGAVEFAAGGAKIRLHNNDGTATSYRGVIRSVPSSAGNRIAVNVLGMEPYLRGVVPSETYASLWHPATLAAQAVAARSYAAHQRAARASKPFDLCDTESCQVYGGASAEYPTTDDAVRKTQGEILTYDGEPAFTEFSASNGGWSAAGDEPYLVAMEDPWASAADDRYVDWSVDLSDDQIEKAWPEIGDLEGLTVDGRDGHGEWGGRAGTITVTGDQGEVTMPATTFTTRFHLYSAWLTFSVTEKAG
ncbi:SpoIID/LytB domain-containing protein [Nocardioides mangrovi]|uniref:SpoIID/LytB domain-containing protein n=1 Tax=Nocardioides mangrovi TaxID=2874580 RepID=A0ABS7UIJ3_9ACTN|nr:SpoIID/LytB domain-containing protein [Nocardioides mangrovi]MBZ5740861.1 SpoIID/LytB domain-containing protein [Nocardioides mangrovi]